MRAHSGCRNANPVFIQYRPGPDRIPPWALKECSHLLAAPVTAIFNSSLREGVLPQLWKTATVIPLSKKHPPVSIDNDIRPILLTPVIASV